MSEIGQHNCAAQQTGPAPCFVLAALGSYRILFKVHASNVVTLLILFVKILLPYGTGTLQNFVM